MACEVTFDPLSHRYFRGEKELLSVTTVLQLAGLDGTDGIPRAALEYAGHRGEMAHLACQFLDEGDLDVDSLDSAIVPYVTAWQRFKDEQKPTIRSIETLVAGDEFAGRVDRVLFAGDCFTVLDIKTSGKIRPSTRLQLAAYAYAWSGKKKPVIGRLAVRLDKSGEYEVQSYPQEELESDYEVFQGALRVANWKRRMNSNGTRNH